MNKKQLVTTCLPVKQIEDLFHPPTWLKVLGINLAMPASFVAPEKK